MGVSASIEMQRVAQVVNVQNQHLKDLLGVYGVSQHEIDRYLSSPGEEHRALIAGRRCDTCRRLLPGITQRGAVSTDDPPQNSCPSAPSMVSDTVPTVMPVLSNPILPTPDGTQPSSTVPPVELVPHQDETEALFMFQAEEQEFHDRMHGANTVDDPAAGNSSAPTDVFSPLTDSLDTSDSIIHSRNHSEPLETSCDKAAEILVEIHNHTDPSSARLALGCCGNSSCTVKNTKIFQLMDRFE
jgi:hypothetical protein